MIFITLCSLSCAEFSEVVLFLADFSRSLHSFLEVCPHACFTLAAMGFITKAVEFYEAIVMKLQASWGRLKSKLEKLVSPYIVKLEFCSSPLPPTKNLRTCTHKPTLHSQQCLKMSLRALKSDFAWLIHQLLQVCFISPKERDSSGVRSKNSLDDFIGIVSDIANERKYVCVKWLAWKRRCCDGLCGVFIVS